MTKEKLVEIMREHVPYYQRIGTGYNMQFEVAADAILAAMEAEKQPNREPEPQPKTPGQVAYEAFYGEKDWVNTKWGGDRRNDWHRAAAAVREQRDTEIKKALGITYSGDLVDALISREWPLKDEAIRLRNKLAEIEKVVRS